MTREEKIAELEQLRKEKNRSKGISLGVALFGLFIVLLVPLGQVFLFPTLKRGKKNHTLCVCENKTYRIVKESPPLIRLERLTTELIKKKEGKHLSSSENSLSHTRWNCKYHIVFIPKYRRKVIYGKLKRDMGTILRRLCEMKEVEIVEAHTCKDHIHKDTM